MSFMPSCKGLYCNDTTILGQWSVAKRSKNTNFALKHFIIIIIIMPAQSCQNIGLQYQTYSDFFSSFIIFDTYKITIKHHSMISYHCIFFVPAFTHWIDCRVPILFDYKKNKLNKKETHLTTPFTLIGQTVRTLTVQLSVKENALNK